MPATAAAPTHRRSSLIGTLRRAWSPGSKEAYDALPAGLGPVLYTLHAFLDNRGLLLASALSYTTVLSIVPFLAVAFSITKGLGLYNAPQVYDLLLRVTAGRKEVVEHILGYIQNTNVQTLGTVGTAMLLATAVSMLSTVEGALNTIWKTRTVRGPWVRFTSYTALIVVCPILLFTAMGATATVQGNALGRWLLGFPLAQSMLTALLAVMPFCLVWTIFFLLYKFLPNVRVASLPALVGALIGGSLWQGLQWAYIKFQIGSGSYNAIYGSFAQIPLLLLWLHVSWSIVLFGAQVSRTVQHYRQDLIDAFLLHLPQVERHGLGLLLLVALGKAAAERRLPPAGPVLASRLGLPRVLVDETLDTLAKAGLVTEAATPVHRTFVPLAQLANVPAADVLRILDGDNPMDPPPAWIERFPVVQELIEATRNPNLQPTMAGLLERFGAELNGLDHQNN